MSPVLSELLITEKHRGNQNMGSQWLFMAILTPGSLQI